MTADTVKMKYEWNTIIQGNCQEVLPELIKQKIEFDGAIFSPQYRFGKNPNHQKKEKAGLYNSFDDNQSRGEWLMMISDTFFYLDKLIRKDGVVVMVLSYRSHDPMLPYHAVYRIDVDTRWTLVEEITWKKNKATPFQTSPTHLSRICEKVLVFARKNVDKFRTNKQVSMTNILTGQDFYRYVDNFIEAKNHDHHPDIDHKATYSEELVGKILGIYFPVKSKIIDPFAGLGSTVSACLKKNRIGFGIEIDPLYVQYANNRIKSSLANYF